MVKNSKCRKRLIIPLTTTTLAVGSNKIGTEEMCSTPSRNGGKKLSQPQPVDKKGRTHKCKVQLAKHSKSVKSVSRLAKMWAEQVRNRTVQTETNTRGLKRKLFNPEGGVPKAGRICVFRVCVASQRKEKGVR